MDPNQTPTDLEHRLAPILDLLHKQLVETTLTQRQHQANEAVIQNLVARQQSAALQRELHKLDDADIAHLLALLPSEHRPYIWQEMSAIRAAEVLIELPEPIAESIIQQTEEKRLIRIIKQLDADELSELAEFLPSQVLEAAKQALHENARDWLEASLKYPEDSVGDIMSMDSLSISDQCTLDQAIAQIRAASELPPQTDKLFVENPNHRLVGVLPLVQLIREPGDKLIKECVDNQVISFSPFDDAEDAGLAFERYDLISAPVVDEKNRVVGRLTVESIMDHLRDRADAQVLTKEGLSADTDLFGPIVQGAKQRWPWLFINLLTAFLATRFISLFEDSISQLVALATLMPIVASVGGNTGNQTAALLIRGLAMNQINGKNLWFLYRKELTIGTINGMIWGSVLGVLAWLLYSNWMLGVVMSAAILCNLMFAAIIGISVPVLLDLMKRDPAMGSSVILTFVTDSMGFFIFLGMASLLL